MMGAQWVGAARAHEGGGWVGVGQRQPEITTTWDITYTSLFARTERHARPSAAGVGKGGEARRGEEKELGSGQSRAAIRLRRARAAIAHFLRAGMHACAGAGRGGRGVGGGAGRNRIESCCC